MTTAAAIVTGMFVGGTLGIWLAGALHQAVPDDSYDRGYADGEMAAGIRRIVRDGERAERRLKHRPPTIPETNELSTAWPVHPPAA